MVDEPKFSRGPHSDRPARQAWDVRIETTVTEDMGDDVIVAYKTRGFRSKQDWLRWLIARELYGEIGVMRLRNGVAEEQPEFPR